MTTLMFHHDKPRMIVPRSSGKPVALTESRKQCRVIQRNGQTCDLLPVSPVEWPLLKTTLPIVEI